MILSVRQGCLWIFCLAHLLPCPLAQVLNSRCPSNRECEEKGRDSCSDEVQGLCGACLPGYAAADGWTCHPVTQTAYYSETKCLKMNRAPYSHASSSVSQSPCGPCLPSYIEVMGVCLTEQEVEDLVEVIEHPLLGTGVKSSTGDTEVSRRTETESQQFAVSGGSKHSKSSAIDLPLPSQDDHISALNGTPYSASDLLSPTKAPVSEQPTPSAEKLETDSASGHAAPKHAARVAPKGSEDVNVKEDPKPSSQSAFSKLVIFMIIVGAVVVALIAVTTGGICWYRSRQIAKASEPKEFSGFSPYRDNPTQDCGSCSSGGDNFSHRSMTRSGSSLHSPASSNGRPSYASDAAKGLRRRSSEGPEDGEDEVTQSGQRIVIECRGLAKFSDGPMEVKNPLFEGRLTDAGATGGGTVSNSSSSGSVSHAAPFSHASWRAELNNNEGTGSS